MFFVKKQILGSKITFKYLEMGTPFSKDSINTLSDTKG